MINLGVRHQNDLIHKTRLFSEDWQSSLPNCLSDFQRLAGFSNYFDASGKHKSDSLLVYSKLACSYPSKMLLIALSFAETGQKAETRCSTSSLPQCGHTTLPSSYSAGVSAFENGLLQAWQKKS